MCGGRAAEEEMGDTEEITSLSDTKHEDKAFTSSSFVPLLCPPLSAYCHSSPSFSFTRFPPI
jgi:hypothetical protein